MLEESRFRQISSWPPAPRNLEIVGEEDLPRTWKREMSLLEFGHKK